MMQKIKIYMVEDQPAILRAQLKLFAQFHRLEIVGYSLTAIDALKKISDLELKPDIIICDLDLPKMDGVKFTQIIKNDFPKIQILIFTVFESEDRAFEAIKLGAAGYLLKGADADIIYRAILDISEGGSVIQASLARKLLKRFAMPLDGAPSGLKECETNHYMASNGHKMELSLRELECLQVIAKGLNNNEAASVLGISITTIKTHLEHIYQKLDVNNRVEAVTEGIRQGLINL